MAQVLWLHCDPKQDDQLLDRETGKAPRIANNRDLTVNIGAFDNGKPRDLTGASTIAFELYDDDGWTSSQFLTKNHTGSITSRIRLSNWNRLKDYNAQVVCTDDDLNYSLGALASKTIDCRIKLTNSDSTIESLGRGPLIIGSDGGGAVSGAISEADANTQIRTNVGELFYGTISSGSSETTVTWASGNTLSAAPTHFVGLHGNPTGGDSPYTVRVKAGTETTTGVTIQNSGGGNVTNDLYVAGIAVTKNL